MIVTPSLPFQSFWSAFSATTADIARISTSIHADRMSTIVVRQASLLGANMAPTSSPPLTTRMPSRQPFVYGKPMTLGARRMLQSPKNAWGNRMGYVDAFLAMAVAVLCAIRPISAADLPPVTTQSAQAAFQVATAVGGSHAHWRLCDMGTSAGRAAFPQQEFAERMRRGHVEPGAGGHRHTIDALSESLAQVPQLVRVE